MEFSPRVLGDCCAVIIATTLMSARSSACSFVPYRSRAIFSRSGHTRRSLSSTAPPPRIAAHTHTRYFSISTHLQIPPSIESAAVMALQLMRADPESAECLAFSEGLVPLSLDPTKTIRENVESTQEIPFGGTDISLPFSWALENGYVYLDFLVKVKFVAWACQVREMCRRRRVVRGRALTCGNVCMCAQ